MEGDRGGCPSAQTGRVGWSPASPPGPVAGPGVGHVPAHTPSLPGGSSETQPPRAVSCRCHSGPPRPVALTPPPFRKSPVPQESGWISGAQRHTPSPEWIVPASASLALGTGAALQPLRGGCAQPWGHCPGHLPSGPGADKPVGTPETGPLFSQTEPASPAPELPKATPMQGTTRLRALDIGPLRRPHLSAPGWEMRRFRALPGAASAQGPPHREEQVTCGGPGAQRRPPCGLLPKPTQGAASRPDLWSNIVFKPQNPTPASLVVAVRVPCALTA